ncbi:BadF/BadG/BcrA/BcrD ATPase family protein [Nesterenkonia halophila]|uniref:BadF/BadG/BcrA/BcrD ATPase family protein n=1 Tax=Nesterenkonia halophila TaxID=302044 RepID=UPI001FE82CB6|nr:BadF/BadG/BcrA/BcrD ATPase family protein [Nesterenkonia halophila]
MTSAARDADATQAPSAQEALLALDAGQTSTKAQIVAPDGGRRDLRLDGVRTDQPLPPQLCERIREAVAESGTRVGTVAVGVSGLTDAERDVVDLLEGGTSDDARGAGSPHTVLLTHDSVTSALGALGDARGAVVAAGTGVVTLGLGRDAVARVDGWGHIMGDAGSAHWIGQQALIRVMRAHDGRGPSTALTEAVRRRWADLESAYIALQSDPRQVSIVASFAADVSRLAADDAVAAAVCVEAAEELAASAATALHRVGEADGAGTDVAVTGGVFDAPAIREQFTTRLAEEVPAARVVSARGEGGDGAEQLVGLAADHPLQSRIARASRFDGPTHGSAA